MMETMYANESKKYCSMEIHIPKESKKYEDDAVQERYRRDQRFREVFYIRVNASQKSGAVAEVWSRPIDTLTELEIRGIDNDGVFFSTWKNAVSALQNIVSNSESGQRNIDGDDRYAYDYLFDDNISLKAKGILGQILVLQNRFNMTAKGLAERFNRDSICAVGGAISELERAGYLIRLRVRDEHGRLGPITYAAKSSLRQHDDPVDPAFGFAD